MTKLRRTAPLIFKFICFSCVNQSAGSRTFTHRMVRVVCIQYGWNYWSERM